MQGEELSQATRHWLESGRRVEVAGHEIFVREQGAGPWLLLVHGFPTSCFDWRTVIDRLARHFHCVSFDFVGFGLSDKPAAYSYSLFQQTDLIESLARRLGIDRAHVLSHDMGTSAHAELLAREREGRAQLRCATSTFLNGSLLKERATLVDFQRMLEDPQRLAEASEFCAKMLPAYVPGLKRLMARPESIGEEDAQVMTELLRFKDGQLRLPNISAYVRERYLHRERWIGAIRSTASKVQLVWGAEDPVANVLMGRALRDLLPNARYRELPGVGHFVPIEAPEAVARAVVEIVDPS